MEIIKTEIIFNDHKKQEHKNQIIEINLGDLKR